MIAAEVKPDQNWTLSYYTFFLSADRDNEYTSDTDPDSSSVASESSSSSSCRFQPLPFCRLFQKASLFYNWTICDAYIKHSSFLVLSPKVFILEIDSSSRGERAARASPLSHGKLRLPGVSDVIQKRPLIQEISQEPSSSTNNAGKEQPPTKKEK